MSPSSGLTCREFVELVTEFLEGTMPGEDRSRFEQHLAICPGCATYVDQMRQTISLVGRIAEESIPTEAQAVLLRAFRDWRKHRGDR
ncbi:MAG: anti-sigma factor family protein [Chloroflexota bacterium]